MLALFARAAVRRLRSEGDLDVDEQGAVSIEQRLEDLLRSGLIAGGPSRSPRALATAGLFRKSLAVERRTAVLARTPPVTRSIRISEDRLRRFLDVVASALCEDERVPRLRCGPARIGAALRKVFPSRVEVDPESPVDHPTGWVPPVGTTGAAGPTGAPAAVGDEPPAPVPPCDPDDGFDLD